MFSLPVETGGIAPLLFPTAENSLPIGQSSFLASLHPARMRRSAAERLLHRGIASADASVGVSRYEPVPDTFVHLFRLGDSGVIAASRPVRSVMRVRKKCGRRWRRSWQVNRIKLRRYFAPKKTMANTAKLASSWMRRQVRSRPLVSSSITTRPRCSAWLNR